MKYTQVRSFHAVAKSGSFTGAAKDLNVSQPTISEQVKELESTYGIELFNRAQRKANLTAAGRSLFEITQRLFGVVREIDAFLKAARDYGAGHLRVSSVLPFFIIDIVTAFHEHYPKVKISVSAGNSAAALKEVIRQSRSIVKTPSAMLSSIMSLFDTMTIEGYSPGRRSSIDIVAETLL